MSAEFILAINIFSGIIILLREIAQCTKSEVIILTDMMVKPSGYIPCDSGERYSIAKEMAFSRDSSGNFVCTKVKAECMMMWLEENVVLGALGSGKGVYTLNQFELKLHHDILSFFVPDDTRSTEGSIHRRIEEWLGASIVHTKDEARNCSVVTKWTRLNLARE